MNRNQIRTILIIAIVLYCIGCAVACKEKPKTFCKIVLPKDKVIHISPGYYGDSTTIDTFSIGSNLYVSVRDTTTDNDWIKDSGEIKNIEQ